MDGEAVPPEADGLFGLEPAAFVAERDALAAELRRGGRPDVARAVRSLRRPTVAAHAMNRLARAHPDLMARVESAGGELARVQRRALSGVRGADVRGAVRAHHDAVDALLSFVDPPVGVPIMTDLRRTLMAIAVDADLAAAVRRGVVSRLDAPADASAALTFGSPLTVVGRTPTSVEGEEPPPEDRPGQEEAAQQREDAEQQREAARLRRETRARIEAARVAVDGARRRLEQRRTERVATQRRLRRSAMESDVARAGVVEAATAVEQARQRLEQATAAAATADAVASAAAETTRLAETADRDAAALMDRARDAVEAAERDLMALEATDEENSTT